jgi:glycosyltransferase involved in cell wall biosynthesis
MNSNFPKVSVIMPVYNSGNYLTKAVNSILTQSLEDIELILIDDGSTDGSSKHCDEFANKDGRIIVIHQENTGICNARNNALTIAKGEYIAFCDHDDEYCPDLLLYSYEAAIKVDADIVKFGSNELQIRGDKIVAEKRHVIPHKFFSRKEVVENFFELYNLQILVSVWDGIYKREFIESNNISFDENFKSGGEDIDFMYKALVKVNRIVLLPEIFYIHYLRFGFSTSTKIDLNKLNNIRMFPKLFNHCLNGLNIEVEKEKEFYTYFWVKDIFGSLMHILSNPNLNILVKEKIIIIQDILSNDFLPPWCFKIPNKDIIKKFKFQYILLFFLLKYKLYKIGLFIYTIKYYQFRK